MPQTRHVSKRKNRKEGVALGIVGISLSLAGGAFAAAAVPPMDTSSRPVAPGGEITLYEEEVADVSLATFYVFDKEAGKPHGVRLAAGGCGGCMGCGCGGCGCAWACSASGSKDTWEVPRPPHSAKPAPARRGWKASGSKRRTAPY